MSYLRSQTRRPGHARRTTAALLSAALALGSLPAHADVQTKTFSKPMVSGNYLDLCYSGSNCAEGKAQNAYCESRGYDRATNWNTAVVPFLQATRKIGDGGLCNTGCTMITSVQCEKNVAGGGGGGGGGKGIDPGAALAIGAGAAIIGGIIGQMSKNKKAKQVEEVPEATGGGGGGMSTQHIDWCYAKYKTYKASTNSYAGKDGLRHQCNSPYN
jgi:hypothetical protein